MASLTASQLAKTYYQKPGKHASNDWKLALGSVHRGIVPLSIPSKVVGHQLVLVWKNRQGFLLADNSASSTGASAVSCLWRSTSDTCLCLTVSSTVLAWASSLMRRLSRQLCAVFSVLRSCALVKLYSVVSCTSFRTSSRVALAVVSWSTCCCRLSSVKASLLFSGAGAFFWGRGMSGLWTVLGRVEPKSRDEHSGVMYFDYTTRLRFLPRMRMHVRRSVHPGAPPGGFHAYYWNWLSSMSPV